MSNGMGNGQKTLEMAGKAVSRVFFCEGVCVARC